MPYDLCLYLKGMSLICSLPKYVLLAFVKDWLMLYEVCDLDTALCCQTHRMQFLHVIGTSIGPLSSYRIRPTSIRFISWAWKRNIKVENYNMLVGDSSSAEFHELSFNTDAVVSLTATLHLTDSCQFSHLFFLQQCVNLKELTLRCDGNLSAWLFSSLISNMQMLESLELHGSSALKNQESFIDAIKNLSRLTSLHMEVNENRSLQYLLTNIVQLCELYLILSDADDSLYSDELFQLLSVSSGQTLRKLSIHCDVLSWLPTTHVEAVLLFPKLTELLMNRLEFENNALLNNLMQTTISPVLHKVTLDGFVMYEHDDVLLTAPTSIESLSIVDTTNELYMSARLFATQQIQFLPYLTSLTVPSCFCFPHDSCVSAILLEVEHGRHPQLFVNLAQHCPLLHTFKAVNCYLKPFWSADILTDVLKCTALSTVHMRIEYGQKLRQFVCSAQCSVELRRRLERITFKYYYSNDAVSLMDEDPWDSWESDRESDSNYVDSEQEDSSTDENDNDYDDEVNLTAITMKSYTSAGFEALVFDEDDDDVTFNREDYETYVVNE